MKASCSKKPKKSGCVSSTDKGIYRNDNVVNPPSFPFAKGGIKIGKPGGIGSKSPLTPLLKGGEKDGEK